MPSAELPPPIWVDTASGLTALADDLRAQPAIAVDTESNSLHAYRERICLIQFSTPTADYLLDPIALGDLSPLAPIFADPRLEKIFHAAEYDLSCLRRDFGWQVNSLFDTMVAARTLGRPQMGLASLLESEFGLAVNKRHQRANWAKRPLTADVLAYAQMDTHYLRPLRDKLAAELEAKACWDEAQEEFERLTRLDGAAGKPAVDPLGFWRVSGARLLSGREAAILRELYLYREQVASRLDRPPFKVMGDTTLLALAKAQPRTLDDLDGLRGMTRGQIDRHGKHILLAAAAGRRAPPQHPPPPERKDDEAVERYDKLRRWRRLKAQERGVESDVIVPREVLWEIARRPPQRPADLEQIAGLGPVRRAKYADEIMGVLSKPVRKLSDQST